MTDRFRITLAQLNATVGDLDGNAALARKAWEAGRAADAQLVALPEMFITGYNTQDLVMKPAFHFAAIEAIKAETGASSMKDMGTVMGALKAKHGAVLDGKLASGLVKAALS